jgi:glycosyltransferase involved in cell wall biosynthesis
MNRLEAELDIRERCLFLGNRQDVDRLDCVCDLTVLLSLFEGTPSVALESIACGVLVIATQVSDNAQIIPHGRAA